jgi:hypothetical protein
MKIIVSTPTWVISGVNSFNLNLLRGLQAAGHDVELLLIPQDSPANETLPLPDDIPVKRLDIDPTKPWWITRWTALEQYLTSIGPCVYLPGYDFQNASIVPALGDEIIVVGVVHSDDVDHYEHLARMGRYWNAVVRSNRLLRTGAGAWVTASATSPRCRAGTKPAGRYNWSIADDSRRHRSGWPIFQGSPRRLPTRASRCDGS